MALVILILCFTVVGGDVCKPLTGSDLKGILSNGDIILGGIFPLHYAEVEDHPFLKGHPPVITCNTIRPRPLQWAMAMMFAIQEINEKHSLIPNITLGYGIYDTCWSISKIYEYGLRVMQQSIETDHVTEGLCSPHAIVGPYSSALSKPLNNILSLFLKPQISFGAGCKCFSDKTVFASFLRTYPSDLFWTSAVVRLVNYFQWTYVGVMNVEDDYGRNVAAQFVTEVENENTCLAFQETWPLQYEEHHLLHLGNVVAKTKANIIFILWHYKDIVPLAEVFLVNNISEKTWLGLISSSSIKLPRYAPIFLGALGFYPFYEHIPGFYEFLISRKPDMLKFSGHVEFARRKVVIEHSQVVNSTKEKRDSDHVTFVNPDLNGIFHNVRKHLTEIVLQNGSHSCNILSYYYSNKSGDFNDILCVNEETNKPMHNYSFNKLQEHVSIAVKGFQKLILSQLSWLGKRTLIPGNYICSLDPLTKRSFFPKNDMMKKVKSVNDNRKGMSIFMNELWELIFNCSFDTERQEIAQCRGEEKLEETKSQFTDFSQFQQPYNVYIAVYVIAHALDDMVMCKPHSGPFTNGSCANVKNFASWQLLFYIRNVSFAKNKKGDIFKFDENGDTPANYELLNWQLDNDGKMNLNPVGSFNPRAPQGEDLQINESAIQWNDGNNMKVPRSMCSEPCQPGTRKVSLKGEPFCCFDCIPCTDGQYSNTSDSQDCQHCPEDLWSNTQHSTCLPMPREFLAFTDPLALTLLAFAVLGFTMVVIVCIMMVTYRKLIAVKSKSSFHFVLLVALAINFTSSVGFVGEPTDLSCQWRESVALGMITFSIICVLTNAYDILMNSQESCNNQKRRCFQPKVLLVLCSLPQTGFSVAWAVVETPQPHKNLEYRLGTIVLECVGASPLWVSCALCYLGVLVTSCLVMAMKGSKIIPGSSELRFIIFSMLFFCMVSIAFVPAYSSTQGKFSAAVEIFAIVAIVYGLLGCVILPQCYTIYKCVSVCLRLPFLDNHWSNRIETCQEYCRGPADVPFQGLISIGRAVPKLQLFIC